MFKTSTKKLNSPRHSAWRMVRWATASLICFNLTGALYADQKSSKSIKDLLAQGEITIGSMLPEQPSLPGNIPKILPKVTKWQQSLTRLREVPNSNGILVRVEVKTPGSSLDTVLPSSPASKAGEVVAFTAPPDRRQSEFAALIPNTDQPSDRTAALDVASAPVTIDVNIDYTHVSVEPKQLKLSRVGQEANLRVRSSIGTTPNELHLFVRNQAIVLWHPERKTLKALAAGATELYVVVDGQMHIVPIQVEVDQKTVASPLTVASSLLSLRNLLGGYESTQELAALDSKSKPNLDSWSQSKALPVVVASLGDEPAKTPITVRAFKNGTQPIEVPAEPASPSIIEPIAAIVNEEKPTAVAASSTERGSLQTPSAIQVYAYKHNERVEAKLTPNGSRHGLSVSASEADAARTLKNAAQAPVWTREVARANYKTVTFQVVDERSELSKGIVYPVTQATVKVIGTEFKAVTNASGNVTLSDVPGKGRLIVAIDDPRGTVRPTVSEVHLSEIPDRGVIRLPVLSYKAFDFYQNVSGVAQRADLSSLCIRLAVNDPQQMLSGYQARINKEAEGPLYFSGQTPSREQAETGADGRVCYFNVEPGLVELTIDRGGEKVGGAVMSLVAGRHQEEDLSLNDGPEITTRLVSVASAKDQVFGDKFKAHQVRPVDSTDLMVVGDNDNFTYDQPGRMRLSAGQTFWNSRAYMYVNSGEFEPTMYALNREDAKSRHVTQLFLRGYIEDLFQELYVENDDAAGSFDPSMGSLVIHHGNMEGQGNKGVNIKVLNQSGYEISNGWYYGSDSEYVTKAVYFNLPSGLYNVIVTAEDNSWLAAETALVDHGVMTYVETGARLSYQRNMKAEEVEQAIADANNEDAAGGDKTTVATTRTAEQPTKASTEAEPSEQNTEPLANEEAAPAQEEQDAGMSPEARAAVEAMEDLKAPNTDPNTMADEQQGLARGHGDIGVTFDQDDQAVEDEYGNETVSQKPKTQVIEPASEESHEILQDAAPSAQPDQQQAAPEPEDDDDETGVVFDAAG